MENWRLKNAELGSGRVLVEKAELSVRFPTSLDRKARDQLHVIFRCTQYDSNGPKAAIHQSLMTKQQLIPPQCMPVHCQRLRVEFQMASHRNICTTRQLGVRIGEHKLVGYPSVDRASA